MCSHAYLNDVYTLPANLSGLPALSVPAGVSSSSPLRLPIGLQLVGPAHSEGRLMDVGEWIVRRAAVEEEQARTRGEAVESAISSTPRVFQHAALIDELMRHPVLSARLQSPACRTVAAPSLEQMGRQVY